MLPALILLVVVLLGTLISFRNWRAGIYLCILIAVLQDPLRKMTDDSPAYMVLAFVPVYVAMAIALISQRATLREWRRDYPLLTGAFLLFGVAILFSFVQTASYGSAAIPLGIVGAFSYAGGIPAVLLGYEFPRQSLREIERPLLFYVALTAVALLSVPLEYLNFELPLPVLGTVGFEGAEWRRWYSDHDSVRMISGFYRSPEMMGWHAMCLIAFSMYFMMRKPALRLPMAAIALLGSYCILLSGRRKMYLSLILMVVAMILLHKSWQRSRLITVVLILAMLAVPVVYLFVDEGYVATAQTGLSSAAAKATEKSVTGPLWLMGVVGPFGYGVGTKSQGTQHVAVRIRTPLVEGGFEKVMVELGWIGVLLGGWVLYAFGWSLRRALRQMGPYPAEHTVGVMLVSFLIACAGSFLVAFTCFGDPFVIFFVGFMAGNALSFPRLYRQCAIAPSVTGIHWTRPVGRRVAQPY